MKNWIAGLALAVGSTTALAGNSFDARFASGSTELDDGFDNVELEGVGFDLRAHFDANESVFVRGSGLSTSGDEGKLNGSSGDVDSELRVLRGGAGYQSVTDSFLLYAVAEYGEAKLSVEDVSATDDGFVLSAGIKDQGKSQFLWQAELGYVAFDELSGAVFEFTVGYRITPSVALLLGGQGYSLKDDDEIDYSISHGTLGARFSF